jgi:hypothetical protein
MYEDLSKEHGELKDDYEQRIRNGSSTATGSGSYGVAHSDSLTTLFKLMDIKVTNGRYCEENIKTLVSKFDNILKLKLFLETDNKYLRSKLDEVRFKIKKRNLEPIITLFSNRPIKTYIRSDKDSKQLKMKARKDL